MAFWNKKDDKNSVQKNLNKGLKHDNVENARLKILGSGCAKCNQLEEAVIQAVDSMGVDLSVGHVTDFSKIAAYGVMTTPAIVLDEKVISYGKVLKCDEVIKLLQKAGI